MREGSELSISKRDIINECLRASVWHYVNLKRIVKIVVTRCYCCMRMSAIGHVQILYVDASELEKQVSITPV